MAAHKGRDIIVLYVVGFKAALEFDRLVRLTKKLRGIVLVSVQSDGGSISIYQVLTFQG